MLFTLILAQALGVAPGPLPKAAADRRVAERFADLDLNEDGVIERDEVRARFDLEASAALVLATPQKKKATDARGPIGSRLPDYTRADTWFAAADTDRDGKVSRTELAAMMGADREQLPPQ
jgi:Ca2+-binding EF-hand superfamily protein